jgi:hypothetical protein
MANLKITAALHGDDIAAIIDDIPTAAGSRAGQQQAILSRISEHAGAHEVKKVLQRAVPSRAPAKLAAPATPATEPADDHGPTASRQALTGRLAAAGVRVGTVDM